MGAPRTQPGWPGMRPSPENHMAMAACRGLRELETASSNELLHSVNLQAMSYAVLGYTITKDSFDGESWDCLPYSEKKIRYAVEDVWVS